MSKRQENLVVKNEGIERPRSIEKKDKKTGKKKKKRYKGIMTNSKTKIKSPKNRKSLLLESWHLWP